MISEEMTGKLWRFYKMNTPNRNPWKNLLYTVMHWFLSVLLGFVSAYVLYSFPVDTGETYASFLFSGSIYHVNYLTFPLGIILFLLGFYFLWKRCLVPDWKMLSGRNFGWRVVYVLFGVAAVVAVFFVGILGLLLSFGLSGQLTPEWIMWAFCLYPVYMVLLMVSELIRSRREKL